MATIDKFQQLQNSSGKIKDWYSKQFIHHFVEVIGKRDKKLPQKELLAAFDQSYKKLELKARLNLIADLLNQFLTGSYKKRLKTLTSLMGEPYAEETGMMNAGYHLYPVSQFVEKFGNEDLGASLDFIYELTQRFTGEWAIRSIANADEKLTLRTLKLWAKDENFHVRRLASEGLRARLPWGQSIEWVKSNPEKTLPIYNKLRNDKILYVRRSVANAMGDLIKINDELAFSTFETWLSKKQTKENLWVIKHAIRHPVKKNVTKYVELKRDVEKRLKKLG